jgi:homoserine O-acetyltransferase
MMRRMIVEWIRNDPDWKKGEYTVQPKSTQLAQIFYQAAMNGGTLPLQKQLPTHEKTQAALDARIKAPFTGDANDAIYQWGSSADYNPGPNLEKIQATLLAINSDDDERNPAATGLLDREIKRVKNGRVFLIRGTEDTAGHGTTGSAKWWKNELDEVLKSAPRGL